MGTGIRCIDILACIIGCCVAKGINGAGADAICLDGAGAVTDYPARDAAITIGGPW